MFWNGWQTGMMKNYYETLGENAANPLGPESGQYRVLRGGSWVIDGYSARSADRGWNDPSSSSYYIGFRCSRSP